MYLNFFVLLYFGDVGSKAMLYLHVAPSVEVMHLSFFSVSHLFFVSSVPCFICSVSHLFFVSSIPCLICSASQFSVFPNSQVMSQRQATSRNQSCMTIFKIGGSWSGKKYIERAAHPVFSIKSQIRHTIQPIH